MPWACADYATRNRNNSLPGRLYNQFLYLYISLPPQWCNNVGLGMDELDVLLAMRTTLNALKTCFMPVRYVHSLNWIASENMFLCKSNVNQLLFFPTFSNFRIYKCFHVNQTTFLITYFSYVLTLFAIKLSVFFSLLFFFLHLS